MSEGNPGERKRRLRRVRAQLAELLQRGELAQLDAGRGPFRPHPWSTVLDVERYTAALLHQARWIEQARPPWRGTAHWRGLAARTAEELETLAAWLGLSV